MFFDKKPQLYAKAETPRMPGPSTWNPTGLTRRLHILTNVRDLPHTKDPHQAHLTYQLPRIIYYFLLNRKSVERI